MLKLAFPSVAGAISKEGFSDFFDGGEPFSIVMTAKKGAHEETIQFKEHPLLADSIGQVVDIFHYAECPLVVKTLNPGSESIQINLKKEWVQFVRKPNEEEALETTETAVPCQPVPAAADGANSGTQPSRQPSGVESDEWDDDED